MRQWKSKLARIPAGNRVGIAVASYVNDDPRRWESLLALLQCFKAQTWTDWQMLVTHDGPIIPPYDLSALTGAEKRLAFCTTAERLAKFGHPHRQHSSNLLVQAGCRWVVHTNDDNLYAPVFLEWMLYQAQTVKHCQMVYCDMISSHKQWKPLTVQLKRGHIDLGAVMVRDDLAAKAPFDQVTFAADSEWIDRLKRLTKGTAKVPGTLFMHN